MYGTSITLSIRSKQSAHARGVMGSAGCDCRLRGGCLRGRSPGPAEHEVVQDVHGVFAVLAGGVDVTADIKAVLGDIVAGQAAGDLLLGLQRADSALADIVGERNAQVAGESQVVGLAVLHPRGEGVPFLLELPAAGGVKGNPGLRRLAVPVLVLRAGFGVDGVLACGAGGLGGLVQGEQRVDGLLRPGPNGI